jgi:hypothetical protein
MLADGAGSATPQYGGSYELFAKTFTNGVIIQTSSSLHVNGLLEDKAVKHQVHVINIPGATPTTYDLKTKSQWYSTGSYVLFKQSTSFPGGYGNVQLDIHNPWETPGLTITIQKIGTSTSWLADVIVRSDTINPASLIYTSASSNGFTEITSAYDSYNTSIELISDGANWYTKSSHGSWSGS